MLKKYITEGAELLPGDARVSDAVIRMRDLKVSSVLVHEEDRLAGIITERDIVHKFTLLDKGDKLNARLRAFMTRPVRVVRLTHLVQDIVDLHQRFSYRHFPVVLENSLNLGHLFGIIIFSDLARNYLEVLSSPENKKGRQKKGPVAELGLLAYRPEDRRSYQNLFEALNFRVQILSIPPAPELFNIPPEMPLILDLDHFPLQTVIALTGKLKQHKSMCILLTSDARIAEPAKAPEFRAGLRICLKPLNLGVINSLLLKTGGLNTGSGSWEGLGS